MARVYRYRRRSRREAQWGGRPRPSETEQMVRYRRRNGSSHAASVTFPIFTA
jgi:hypothetical protein